MYVAWKKHWLDLPEFAWVCLDLRGPHALRVKLPYCRSITTHPPATHEEKREVNSNRSSNGYVKTCPKLSRSKGSSVTGLSVVPVQVRTKRKSETVETYAFLDSGSNTSFCTESLLEKLKEQGKKTKLSLTTMHGKGPPVQCSVVELEVFDLDNQNRAELSRVYSTPSLPVCSDCIGKQEDIERWPYQRDIVIPHINAEIGLLIGSDVPEILQPYEVWLSENGGPYASKTLLGPLWREDSSVPIVNYIQTNSTGSLNERFEKFCNMEFNDVTYETKPSMSQNDKKALGIMEQAAKLVNVHYEIGLPWKNNPPHLSNNRLQAEQCLRSLKRRLQHDPSLLEKYRKFMADLLCKDYARKISNQDRGPLRTQWYLPHHPVFHPQKPDKVRVVFDCSAKHRETSLNDQLLQGPHLTNTLVGVLTRFREEPVAFIAEIEAMFYQVRVPSEDCHALRFLWWP